MAGIESGKFYSKTEAAGLLNVNTKAIDGWVESDELTPKPIPGYCYPQYSADQLLALHPLMEKAHPKTHQDGQATQDALVRRVVR